MLAALMLGDALASDPEVNAELGEGLTVHGSGDASFQIRGRVQERVSVLVPAGEDPEVAFQVRRMRVLLVGKLPKEDLQIYIQLGLAVPDMESDLRVPLRDAAIIWSPTRDLALRIGQMKVPFSRERVVSSSALQFPDRSIVNAELSLDRDIGIQAFSTNLFGWGDRLGYQVGVFNGDGRNRFVGDTGLLYIARLELRPLGAFDDALIESDLERGPARLVIGMGVARNEHTVRERSTHGDVYLLDGFTDDHAEIDVMFKARGLSLHAEALARQADHAENSGTVDGEAITEASRSAYGFMAAAGYHFGNGLEPAVRYAEVRPLPGIATDIRLDRELRAGLSWYVHGHDLKLQTDYGYLQGDAFADGAHEIRSQLQVYF